MSRRRGSEIVGYGQQQFFQIVKEIHYNKGLLSENEFPNSRFTLQFINLWASLSRGDITKIDFFEELEISDTQIESTARTLNISKIDTE